MCRLCVGRTARSWFRRMEPCQHVGRAATAVWVRATRMTCTFSPSSQHYKVINNTHTHLFQSWMSYKLINLIKSKSFIVLLSPMFYLSRDTTDDVKIGSWSNVIRFHELRLVYTFALNAFLHLLHCNAVRGIMGKHGTQKRTSVQSFSELTTHYVNNLQCCASGKRWLVSV